MTVTFINYCYIAAIVITVALLVLAVFAAKDQDDSNDETTDRYVIVYAILAVFGASLGLHNFYIRKYGLGIIDILFCWTGIPALVGFIKGAIRLFRLKNVYELV